MRMRLMLCLLMIGASLTGCNSVTKNETMYESQLKKINSMGDMVRCDVKTTLFEKNQNDKFVKVMFDGGFEANIKDTGDTIIIANEKEQINECIDDAVRKVQNPTEFLYMLEYRYEVDDIKKSDMIYSDNILADGTLEHNGNEWKYIIETKKDLAKVRLSCENKNTNKEFIVKTTWVTQDIDIIMKNIEFALNELELKMG